MNSSLLVSALACNAVDPGSIERRGKHFLGITVNTANQMVATSLLNSPCKVVSVVVK